MKLEINVNEIGMLDDGNLEASFTIDIDYGYNLDNLLEVEKRLVASNSKRTIPLANLNYNTKNKTLKCVLTKDLLKKLMEAGESWVVFVSLTLDRDKLLFPIIQKDNSSIFADQEYIFYFKDVKELRLEKLNEENVARFLDFKLHDINFSYESIVIHIKFNNFNEKCKIKDLYLVSKNTKKRKFLPEIISEDEVFVRIDKNKIDETIDRSYFIYLDVEFLSTNYKIPLKKEDSFGLHEEKTAFINYDQKIVQCKLQVDSKNNYNLAITHDLGSYLNCMATKFKTVDNLMVIEGKASLLPDLMDDSGALYIGFVNRRTNHGYFEKIENYTINNGDFNHSIQFKNVPFIEENGTWDVYLKYRSNKLTLKSRLKINDGYYFNWPTSVYNQEFIKRIRAYVTKDGELSILVRDELIKMNVDKIIYSDNVLNIIGSIQIPDISNFLIEKIYASTAENPSDSYLNFNFDIEQLNDEIKFNCFYDFSKQKLSEKELLFYLTILIDEMKYNVRLKSNIDGIINKSRSVIYPEFNVDSFESRFQIKPFFSDKNELNLSIKNNLEIACSKAKISSKEFVFTFEFTKGFERYQNQICGLSFYLEDKKTCEILKYPIKNWKSESFEIKINYTSFPLESIQWEPYIMIDLNEHTIKRRVTAKPKLVKKNSTFKKNAMKRKVREKERDLCISFFFNSDNSELEIEQRKLKEYENKISLLKFRIAKVVSFFTRSLTTKITWLVGENLGEVAQDNGFAFFKYCIKNNKKENVLYVAKKSNKHLSKLLPYRKNIIFYDSFRHMVNYHNAEYLIVSHGIRDVIPEIAHPNIRNNPKDIIYLQHGIIAMKRLFFNRASYNNKIKKFIVSSNREKQIMMNEMRFRPDQLAVTGLARFDNLYDKSHLMSPREILVMPTWREWTIESEEGFKESLFYSSYKSLLKDTILNEILEKNNLILKFYPHFEIQKKYLHLFNDINNERIKIIDISSESIQELIQTSALMVTDYSSVAFDFNYLKKPVIFYQFDLDEYMTHRGSYVDLQKDLFGDVAQNKEQVIKYINEYATNDFKYKDKYFERSKEFYMYNDQRNSERIYNTIKSIKESNESS